MKGSGKGLHRSNLVYGLPKAIDIVSTVLERGTVVVIETLEGVVYVVSPEDVITAYLRGWKY